MSNSSEATPPTIPCNAQVIVPLYTFTCSGVITQWSALVEGDGNQLVEFQVYERLSNGKYNLVGVNRFVDKPVNGILSLPVPERHQITVHNNHVVGLFIDGDQWSVVYSHSQDVASLYFPAHGPFNLIDSSTEDWNILEGAPIINATISKQNLPLNKSHSSKLLLLYIYTLQRVLPHLIYIVNAIFILTFCSTKPMILSSSLYRSYISTSV